jgi:murein DD-endopeptidase MepM/ murein hydrolase activator NlpD
MIGIDSVDKQNMIEAIAIQHIEHRRPSTHTGTYRTDLLNQRPVHKKRPQTKAPREGRPLFKTAETSLRKNRAGSSYDTAAPEERSVPLSGETSSREGGLGTFFRSLMLPMGILAGAVGFFVISNSTWSVLSPIASPIVTPIEDTRYHQDLAAYAGILSADFLSVPETEGEDIPLDLMESFTWKSYTVKQGDSVSKIAETFGLSMDAIIASNNITNAKRLSAGQVLRIPNMDGIPYTVKRGDSLAKISSAQGVPLAALLDANEIQSDSINPGTVLFLPGVRMRTEDLKLALGEAFAWPIRGRLTSPYGWRSDPISGVRKHHAALDLAANKGTPIKAAMDGKVATVGYNGTYGNFIILTHSNGFQTMYAHMSVTSVTQGTYVNQGTKIGEVGSTGYSTGPHLHFAIYKNGTAVNPLDYLGS